VTLALESVPINEGEAHDYVVDWSATPLSATRRTDANGDGQFGQPKTIRPPQAALTYAPQAPGQASLITFDASGSTDPDDNVATYVWNFGDGTAYEGDAVEAHGYRTAGTYTVRLTVRDADGAVDRTSTTVEVSGGLYLPLIAK
jgi:PKD repeat protein